MAAGTKEKEARQVITNRYWVCHDCAGQFPMGTGDPHYCLPRRVREMAEWIDGAIAVCDDPRGLLWLIRIAYRWRKRMNGVEQYGDRAALARRVLELMGDGK